MNSTQLRRRTAVPVQRGTVLRLPPHPSAPDPGDLAAVRRWVSTARHPRAIDLFCGAGGLSLGLRDAGFSVLLGADSDPWAVETHTANLGGLGYVGDLSQPDDLLEHLDGWGLDHVELVAGGVPCQPFSRAGQAKLRELIRSGHRHPQDPRAGLWYSFMAVVERLRPELVLVENVPDLPSWDDGAVLSGFLETLGELGYAVDARILDCYLHGVPQHRSRLILVGARDGRVMDWPEPQNEFVTVRDAIGDLPPVPGGQRCERLAYHPRPGSSTTFQRRMRKNVASNDRRWTYDHITRSVRPDDWEAYTILAPGQTYADIPAHLQRYRTDIFTDKYKRLAWDELARTITAHIAKDGYWYIHPEQHRTLSIREAARLQTFPDWFRFAGQPSHRYTQIGNAVPPLVAAAVGRSLATALAGEPREVTDSPAPREQLLAWHDHEPSHPWRRPGTDSWQVLAGELCLDRCSAREQSERFDALRRLASTPQALLSLDSPHRLLTEIGLSQHSAEAILEAARTVMELFGGDLPADDLQLRAIPGVGDSVAKTVMCFGHGRSTVPLHSAAARVAGRVAGRAQRRRWQLRLDLHHLARPGATDAAFNAAVLRLGSATCTPTRPACHVCPIRSQCATGNSTNAQTALELATA